MTTTVTTASTSVSTTMMTSSPTDPTDSDTGETSSDMTDPESGGSDPEDSSGGGSGPDQQPADGVYSECETTVECVGATACVLVGSTGYCSNACTIPSDCPPSPGGTSTPACFPANIGGVDMQVCAIDCSAGKTCPTGMSCEPLGGNTVCV